MEGTEAIGGKWFCLFVFMRREKEKRREEKTDLLVSQRIYHNYYHIYVNDMKFLNDVVLLFANSRTPNVGFSLSPKTEKTTFLGNEKFTLFAIPPQPTILWSMDIYNQFHKLINSVILCVYICEWVESVHHSQLHKLICYEIKYKIRYVSIIILP